MAFRLRKYPSDDTITNYAENQCGNCHATLGEKDKYCKKCGTKRGEGAFAPYKNVMRCIYGPPPVERTHLCSGCGYQWTTIAMIDTDKYCPQCGRKLDEPATK